MSMIWGRLFLRTSRVHQGGRVLVCLVARRWSSTLNTRDMPCQALGVASSVAGGKKDGSNKREFCFGSRMLGYAV